MIDYIIVGFVAIITGASVAIVLFLISKNIGANHTPIDLTSYIGKWYVFDCGRWGWSEQKILEIRDNRVKYQDINGHIGWAYSDWYYKPINCK